MMLQQEIERLFALPSADVIYDPHLEDVCTQFVQALNAGQIRAASPGPNGSWVVNMWVKQGILLLFRKGKMVDMSTDDNFVFFDKDTIPTKTMHIDDNVRIVPGGSSIRTGAYLSPGVICMPPMYINIGAWIGQGTMIDSHALVGTCAQIGARVHISAAAQIGGVLEPAGARPVVIEDDVMVGGNCGVYEGVLVRKRAVLGSGVVLNASTPVYDLVNQTVIKSTTEMPLEIPEGAVVVAGSRRIASEWAQDHGLAISTPLIVKYRDEKTDARTALESALR
ncbi:MAG: 2,3,4,5-tetrahydropyridine-2,6-dicarboxylate N-succinyltransferase [Ignavibacteria bacterium]|jgi:2,3,4,5-tetrahydropyridine-2-carboxylate N-succinyltransferase